MIRTPSERLSLIRIHGEPLTIVERIARSNTPVAVPDGAGLDGAHKRVALKVLAAGMLRAEFNGGMA